MEANICSAIKCLTDNVITIANECNVYLQDFPISSEAQGISKDRNPAGRETDHLPKSVDDLLTLPSKLENGLSYFKDAEVKELELLRETRNRVHKLERGNDLLKSKIKALDEKKDVILTYKLLSKVNFVYNNGPNIQGYVDVPDGHNHNSPTADRFKMFDLSRELPEEEIINTLWKLTGRK